MKLVYLLPPVFMDAGSEQEDEQSDFVAIPDCATRFSVLLTGWYRALAQPLSEAVFRGQAYIRPFGTNGFGTPLGAAIPAVQVAVAATDVNPFALAFSWDLPPDTESMEVGFRCRMTFDGAGDPECHWNIAGVFTPRDDHDPMVQIG